MTRILMSKATVGAEEEEAVIRALRSGWVTPLGPENDAFEAEVCERVGARYALALSSGTAALHLALLGLGVKPGTYVVTSSMTFAATANAIAYTGAKPVFVDSRASDGNVDPELMLHAVRTLQDEGKTVAAAVPVDLFGRCVEYDRLTLGLSTLGVPLLADAAESLGATYRGRPAGNFGAATAFSFNGNKIMTTSGGGMLVSDNSELIDYARFLSTQAREQSPWYEHKEIGFNYRMSNILAALGRAQLAKLDSFIKRRQEIRNIYVDSLSDIEGVRFLTSEEDEDGTSDNCWLTAIDLSDSPINATEILRHLESRNIEARHVWKPMHMQPLWGNARAFITGVSESLYRGGITLPSGAGLTDQEITIVASEVRAKLNA